jgi:sterol desaturase/sphingolipid hydroxylase (fatty acid hydroxylase superfamily)
MGPADVLITHTLPVLLALRVLPLTPGFEYTLGKTYLLFQELYGHAGVAHKGRNFGPLPWLPAALGCELKSEDHQLHHIQANVNFSKRFSFMDKLFKTWAAPALAKSKGI